MFKNVLCGTCETLVMVLHKNNIETCVAFVQKECGKFQQPERAYLQRVL